MIDLPENPTTITRQNDRHGRLVWVIHHPALWNPIRIDPTRPGDLTPAGATSWREGSDLTEHRLALDLIAALTREGVCERAAEFIVEAWDFHARGEDPWFDAPAVAHV